MCMRSSSEGADTVGLIAWAVRRVALAGRARRIHAVFVVPDAALSDAPRRVGPRRVGRVGRVPTGRVRTAERDVRRIAPREERCARGQRTAFGEDAGRPVHRIGEVAARLPAGTRRVVPRIAGDRAAEDARLELDAERARVDRRAIAVDGAGLPADVVAPPGFAGLARRADRGIGAAREGRRHGRARARVAPRIASRIGAGILPCIRAGILPRIRPRIARLADVAAPDERRRAVRATEDLRVRAPWSAQDQPESEPQPVPPRRPLDHAANLRHPAVRIEAPRPGTLRYVTPPGIRSATARSTSGTPA